MSRHPIVLTIALVAAVAVSLPAPSTAQAPSIMPMQGSIADADGNPVDGSVSVRFGLYTDEIEGVEVWSETQTVCLAEIADDDGAGSGLDADTVDGLDSDRLRPRVATSQTAATTFLTSSCANYSGGDVTIDVPGPGTVVVEANVYLLLEHTSGTADLLYLGIGTTNTDCSSVYERITWEIPAGTPTDSSIAQTFTVRRTIDVSGAGEATYYLNGYMSSGQSDNDRFWFASMIATYFPD